MLKEAQIRKTKENGEKNRRRFEFDRKLSASPLYYIQKKHIV
jgi:hypothetical protein